MLRVVSARLLVLLVAIPLMDCECSGSSGCADEDYDTPRTVTPKFRVEILDSLDAPVADVAVRIEYFKKYCDGTQSEHVVKEGVTGLEGIYSTELMVEHRTFVIFNPGDDIEARLNVQKDGWNVPVEHIAFGSRIDRTMDLFFHWQCVYGMSGSCELQLDPIQPQ